jgi:ATPase subunit of ABC transporter with duplicated ATPase domains
MSPFLTLDSISAQTPEHQVLFSDLTLSIGAERVRLVGRNGSGKSTLIRIIAGMAVGGHLEVRNRYQGLGEGS